jgi:hypothetical protein
MQLYALRGSAIHRAACLVDKWNSKTKRNDRVPVGHADVSEFIFAADDFLHWTKSQRAKLRLSRPMDFIQRVKYIMG